MASRFSAWTTASALVGSPYERVASRAKPGGAEAGDEAMRTRAPAFQAVGRLGSMGP